MASIGEEKNSAGTTGILLSMLVLVDHPLAAGAHCWGTLIMDDHSVFIIHRSG